MTKHSIVLKPGDTLVVSCKGQKGGNNDVEEEFVIEENSNNNGLGFKSGLEETTIGSFGHEDTGNKPVGGKRFNTTRKAKKSGSKGPNPYMRFANKERAEILRQNPELKSDVKAVARKLGEKWRSMSDSEKAQY